MNNLHGHQISITTWTNWIFLDGQLQRSAKTKTLLAQSGVNKTLKNSGVCGKINGFGTPIGTGWVKFIGTSLNDDMINRLTLVRRSCSSFCPVKSRTTLMLMSTPDY